MKNIFVKFIILIFFASPFSIFGQTREGQVISSALALGYGRSVPLPQGEWHVAKIGNLPGTNAHHLGYLLENKNKNDDVLYLLIQDSRTPNYWNANYYSLPADAKEVEMYSTTQSMLTTKISFLQFLSKNDAALNNFTLLGLDVDKHIDYADKKFAVSHARLINKREAIWYKAIIQLPKSYSDESKLAGAIKRFNNDLIDSMSLSYLEKKQQESVSFSFSEQNLAAIQDSNKILELNKIIYSENKKIDGQGKNLKPTENQISFDAVVSREDPAKSNNLPSQLSKADQLAQLQIQMNALKFEIEKSDPSRIQNNPTAFNRRALVIGNNRYLNIGRLENAAGDALAMAESLKLLGFEVTIHTDLALKDMNASLRKFKSSIQKGDEVVFFYAGHGIQIGQTNFLLPIDITGESEDQIRDDAVLLDRVLDDISEKKAKFTLAMLDACRDNPFKKSGRSISAGARGLAPASTANGQMIIFSAGAGQQALDKLGPNDKEKNGLFTRIFIKEMQKPGLSVDRVVRNVRSQVVELARSVKHDQVPAIYDQVIGEFYFKPK